MADRSAGAAANDGGIGFLSSRSPGESESLVAAFRRGLAEGGFVEGQNVSIAFRWAEGRYERLPTLAADLVSLRVAVLFAAGASPSALAARAATSTLPVVFAGVGDPLRAGLNRPGGNVSGMSVLTTSLGAKRVEILNEMVATPVGGFAYLANPTSPVIEIEWKEALEAASARGIKLHIVHASSDDELNAAFATVAKLRADGVVVATEPFFDSRRDRLVALSARHAVPAAYPWREYVAAGGLISYGTSLTDSYRRAAIYASRILKGEKPADLPVMQPTRFELVIKRDVASAGESDATIGSRSRRRRSACDAHVGTRYRRIRGDRHNASSSHVDP
jgi:putative tryptophan/tyrosine transport system substrate-binding protein